MVESPTFGAEFLFSRRSDPLAQPVLHRVATETASIRLRRAGWHSARPADLCLDRFVGSRGRRQLGERELEYVLGLLVASLATMSESEVRDDPPFVLFFAELAQGRGSYFEERDCVAVVADVAQRERQVVLGQRDGAAIVEPMQDLQRAAVQLHRLRVGAVSPVSRTGRVEPKGLTVKIDRLGPLR